MTTGSHSVVTRTGTGLKDSALYTQSEVLAADTCQADVSAGASGLETVASCAKRGASCPGRAASCLERAESPLFCPWNKLSPREDSSCSTAICDILLDAGLREDDSRRLSLGPDVSISPSSASEQPDVVIKEDAESGAESPALCALVPGFDLILYPEDLLLHDGRRDGEGDEKRCFLLIELHSLRSFLIDPTSLIGDRERSLVMDERLCPKFLNAELNSLDED